MTSFKTAEVQFLPFHVSPRGIYGRLSVAGRWFCLNTEIFALPQPLIEMNTVSISCGVKAAVVSCATKSGLDRKVVEVGFVSYMLIFLSSGLVIRSSSDLSTERPSFTPSRD